jgi:hypothetical protein
LRVEIAVLRIAQINIAVKLNFSNFQNWGEIAVFLCSSCGGVCFWANNECWLAACVVWVKRARKKRQKRG